MKKGYNIDIEQQTKDNNSFRHVLYTTTHMQLVLMTLQPGEDIGSETHEDNDQFFRFEAGEGMVRVGETDYTVSDGHAVVVPCGTEHNVINTGTDPLKFYTIYTPAHHKDGIIRVTKAQALAEEAVFDGQTTE